MTFKRNAIELLLAVLEAETPVISSGALDLAGSTVRSSLIASGLIVPHGYDPIVVAIDDHFDTPVSVTPTEDGARYRYYSPTSGWIDVEPSRLLRYRVDEHALMLALAPSEVRLAPRSAAALIENELWEVGSLRIGRQVTEIWFARRLFDPVTLARVDSFLRDHPARDRRFLLTSTKSARLIRTNLNDTTVVAIADVLGLDDGGRIDARSLIGSCGGGPQPDLPLWLSADGYELHIRGQERLTFRGLIQRKLVRCLVDAHTAAARLATDDLLESAGSGATGLPKAFGAKKWKVLKKYLKRREGRWAFEV